MKKVGKLLLIFTFSIMLFSLMALAVHNKIKALSVTQEIIEEESNVDYIEITLFELRYEKVGLSKYTKVVIPYYGIGTLCVNLKLKCENHGDMYLRELKVELKNTNKDTSPRLVFHKYLSSTREFSINIILENGINEIYIRFGTYTGYWVLTAKLYIPKEHYEEIGRIQVITYAGEIITPTQPSTETETTSTISELELFIYTFVDTALSDRVLVTINIEPTSDLDKVPIGFVIEFSKNSPQNLEYSLTLDFVTIKSGEFTDAQGEIQIEMRTVEVGMHTISFGVASDSQGVQVVLRVMYRSSLCRISIVNVNYPRNEESQPEPVSPPPNTETYEEHEENEEQIEKIKNSSAVPLQYVIILLVLGIFIVAIVIVITRRKRRSIFVPAIPLPPTYAP